ncbi:HD-GYP domain-containing protein [Ventrimonas faecis]
MTQREIENIKELFRSFVRVMSSAVDERTPYNATHTRNMAEYGERFISYLNEQARAAGKQPLFDADHREEFLMSVWLHDIGKLVIPLEIMNKDTRLMPEQTNELLHRFEKIHLLAQISCLKGMISEQELKREQEELVKDREEILQANTAGICTDALRAEISRIHEKTYTEEDGSTRTWITDEEFRMLMIRKGTLSEEEREIMESHVVFTDKLLSEIRFSKKLSHVRAWAAAHHELLDGSGYPKHLKGNQIPMEVRMLTILDIFDALVAEDRPYKPGVPVEKALKILDGMANREGKLDPELTRLFAESRCWEKKL